MYKIQKTQTVKKSPSKVKVSFEENTYIISVNTFAHFALYDGKEIEDSELEEILVHDLRSDLFERCVNNITYSPRTQSQVRDYIRKYLKKIGVLELNIDSGNLIEEMIEKLKEFKYINDYEYAELFVKSRIKNKPKSRYFLLSELLSKGIDKELANEVLDSLMPDSLEMLRRVYEKKFKDEPITFEDKKKISYLQRKGFLWDDISQFVNSFNKENED
jgi:regulatory protein